MGLGLGAEEDLLLLALEVGLDLAVGDAAGVDDDLLGLLLALLAGLGLVDDLQGVDVLVGLVLRDLGLVDDLLGVDVLVGLVLGGPLLGLELVLRGPGLAPATASPLTALENSSALSPRATFLTSPASATVTWFVGALASPLRVSLTSWAWLCFWDRP